MAFVVYYLNNICLFDDIRMRGKFVMIIFFLSFFLVVGGVKSSSLFSFFLKLVRRTCSNRLALYLAYSYSSFQFLILDS